MSRIFHIAVVFASLIAWRVSIAAEPVPPIDAAESAKLAGEVKAGVFARLVRLSSLRVGTRRTRAADEKPHDWYANRC